MDAREIVFVAGATGLTGRHVVEAAVRRGLHPIAHVRPDSPRVDDWRARFAASTGGAAEVDTTPWERDAIRQRFAELAPRYVFACLGTTRARAREASQRGKDPSHESYDAVDVALTETTIDAALAAGSVRRFVYLSSIGAGDGARGSYLAARTRVGARLEASGLPYTTVRPSFIVGDRDVERAGENVSASAAGAGLSLLGALGARTLRDRYRSITGAELGEAMVRLALDPVWENRIAQGEDLR